MDFEKQFELNHLLLIERKCNTCGQVKNLVDGYYRTRKDRGPVPSSYSYECKECNVKRVIKNRNNKKYIHNNFTHVDDYPNW